MPLFPARASLLGNNDTTARRATARRRYGRAMHRVMSGLNRKGVRFRFLTLTTQAGVRDTPAEFQQDWRKLKERLRRRGVRLNYIRVVENTKSGLPHAHVLISGGRYVDVWLLSQLWQSVHGAWNVDIREVAKGGGAAPWKAHESLAKYLAKYMSKDPIARLAYSPHWVWPALARSWRTWLKACRAGGISFPQVIATWKRCCEDGRPPPVHGNAIWLLRHSAEGYAQLCVYPS